MCPVAIQSRPRATAAAARRRRSGLVAPRPGRCPRRAAGRSTSSSMPELGAELLAGPLVPVRVRAQPVVEMEAEDAGRARATRRVPPRWLPSPRHPRRGRGRGSPRRTRPLSRTTRASTDWRWRPPDPPILGTGIQPPSSCEEDYSYSLPWWRSRRSGQPRRAPAWARRRARVGSPRAMATQAVLCLINQRRAHAGLGALQENASLDRVGPGPHDRDGQAQLLFATGNPAEPDSPHRLPRGGIRMDGRREHRLGSRATRAARSERSPPGCTALSTAGCCSAASATSGWA